MLVSLSPASSSPPTRVKHGIVQRVESTVLKEGGDRLHTKRVNWRTSEAFLQLCLIQAGVKLGVVKDFLPAKLCFIVD